MGFVLPAIDWTASPNYSSRGGQRVRLVVAHDCEGSFAGSVSWFAQARSRVSANGVLNEDGTRFVAMVAWGNKAWHACDFNAFSEGIEAAGYAAKGLGAPEWQALANVVAYRLKANAIPCQRATAANGWIGWCQHVDLGAAGGGHHDVSSDPAIVGAFAAMIAAAYGEPMPASWGGSSVAPTPAPAAPQGWTPSGTVRHDLPPGSIEWVQAALNAVHAVPVPLIVDGIEGAQTEHAVSVFQGRAGLYVDGIAGPLTIAALEGALG